MGVFTATIEVAATPRGPFHQLDAMVDTGSLYTWVPISILRALGVTPQENTIFVMADGTRIHRDITEIAVRLNGRVRHTISVFGDDASIPLLGAYTLEGFGLAVDPVNKRLVQLEAFPALTLA